MQNQSPQPIKKKHVPVPGGSAPVNRPPRPIPEDPAPPPGNLLTESDLIYLGSFQLPAAVVFAESGPPGYTETNGGTGAIAYRGKGGVDRILTVCGTTQYVGTAAFGRNGNAVYEVTVPTLRTSEPYNEATVHKAWGNIYGNKRYNATVGDDGTVQVVSGVMTLTGATWPSWFLEPPAGQYVTATYFKVNEQFYIGASYQSPTQITLADTSLNAPPGTAYEIWGGGEMKTGGLFVDPENWDRLFFNELQWYGSGQEPAWGEVTLDDATTTPTCLAVRHLTNFDAVNNAGGTIRMPAAFVAAHCPGKPFMTGFATAGWISTVGDCSVGECFFAVPDPTLVTYPNKSTVPETVLSRF